MIQNFRTIANQVAIATIAIQRFGMYTRRAIEEIQKGAMVSQVEKAWNSMATNIGVNANKIVNDLQKLSGETISRFEIMKTASTAALLGVPIDKLSEVMKTARAAATALAGDVTVAFDELVRGIGRGSAQILDNWGIQATGAVRKFAQELGKSEGELTDTERRMATLNVVMKESARIMKQVGTAGSEVTDAERWQILQTTFKDLADTIRQDLLPPFLQMMEGLTKIVRNVSSEILLFRAKVGEGFSGVASDVISHGVDTTRDRLREIDARIKELDKKRKNESIFQFFESPFGVLGPTIIDQRINDLKQLQSTILGQLAMRGSATEHERQLSGDLSGGYAATGGTPPPVPTGGGIHYGRTADQVEQIMTMWRHEYITPWTQHGQQPLATSQEIRSRIGEISQYGWGSGGALEGDRQSYLAKLKSDLDLISRRELREQKDIVKNTILTEKEDRRKENEERNKYFVELLDAMKETKDEIAKAEQERKEMEARAGRMEVFENLRSAMGDTEAFIIDSFDKIAAETAAEGGTFDTMINSFMGGVAGGFETLMASPDMLLFVAVMESLRLVLQGIAEVVDIDSVWKPIKEFFIGVGNMFGTLLIPILQPLELMLNSIFGPNGLMQIVLSVFEAFSPILQVLSPILMIVVALLDMLSPIFGFIGEAIKTILMPITVVMIGIAAFMNLIMEGLRAIDVFGFRPFEGLTSIDLESMKVGLPDWVVANLDKLADEMAGGGTTIIVNAPNATYLDKETAADFVQTGLEAMST